MGAYDVSAGLRTSELPTDSTGDFWCCTLRSIHQAQALWLPGANITVDDNGAGKICHLVCRAALRLHP